MVKNTKYLCQWFMTLQIWQDVDSFSLTNLLKTKRNLFYVRNQSVARCKHFPARL